MGTSLKIQQDVMLIYLQFSCHRLFLYTPFFRMGHLIAESAWDFRWAGRAAWSEHFRVIWKQIYLVPKSDISSWKQCRFVGKKCLFYDYRVFLDTSFLSHKTTMFFSVKLFNVFRKKWKFIFKRPLFGEGIFLFFVFY